MNAPRATLEPKTDAASLIAAGRRAIEIEGRALAALLPRLDASFARACTLCESSLPFKPRPVFLVGRRARLLIVGQAPGRRVHETGLPWNDPSGEVLRDWLDLDRARFYDTSRVAIVPTGLCYPGTVDGVDLPPCRRCAPEWQPRFRAALPHVGLTLLVGSYAQAYHLKERRKKSVGETVRAFREYLIPTIGNYYRS